MISSGAKDERSPPISAHRYPSRRAVSERSLLISATAIFTAVSEQTTTATICGD